MISSNEVESLRHRIHEIDKISDAEWKKTLDERKCKELEFHDRDRDPVYVESTKTTDTYEKFYGNKKYYAATKRSSNYVKSWIESESRGKIFLDYACGNGGNAIIAAKSGAALALGLDISSVSVQNARKIAIDYGLDYNTLFFQADAENTCLPNDSVDIIVCSGMLHHLDLACAIPELRRILKPGGKILAVEALDYNPAIKLYRLLTPDMRTAWEKAHILDLNDIRFIREHLNVEEIHFWHVLGYISGKIPWLFHLTDAIDRVLERVPFVQRLAWIFTFIIKKPCS